MFADYRGTPQNFFTKEVLVLLCITVTRFTDPCWVTLASISRDIGSLPELHLDSRSCTLIEKRSFERGSREGQSRR